MLSKKKMAAAKTDNFYVFLKDRRAKIEDRLKVLRYAWQANDVYIPNKEQVLIDLLTGLLLNKKKEQLNEDDTEKVWKCLQEVLQTGKASYPGLILLRQSSTQMLTDCVSAVNNEYRFTAPLIGCLNAIMKSDSLSTVFTLKMDTMISVLQGLCGVVALSSYRESDILTSLVQHTVDRFIYVLKTAPDQHKIFQKTCETFLPKLIPLWSNEPSVTVQTLSSAAQAVLGNIDHHMNYDIYLKGKHSKSEAHIHKKAKYIEHLFTALAKALQTNKEQCSLYLPVLFENFLTNNCHRGILLTAHFMMQELCTLIGLYIDNSSLSGPIEIAVVFRTVNLLLKSIQERELYDLHLDEKNGNVQFKFYKHIVQILISCRDSLEEGDFMGSYADWYSCFTMFLRLNHLVVEPRLLEIFTQGWIDTKVKEDDVGALDDFLQELMNIYSKLRQVPKLVTKLIGTLCVCSGSQPLLLPPRFLQSYVEVIQGLPQGVLLDVWKKFAAILKSQFVDRKTKREGHFQGTCSLFYLFLVNVRVADYTVTDLTLKSVQELLVVMETDIIAPLLKMALKEKDTSRLKYMLYLSEGWGEVVSMLALYTDYKTSDFRGNAVPEQATDLSYIHGYLEADEWKKIHKLTAKCGDPGLQYVWDMLTIHKVRSVLLFKDKCDWTDLADTIATVFKDLEDADITKKNSDWTGMLEDITETTLFTARWHLISRNLSTMCCVLEEEQLNTVADVAVRSVVHLNPPTSSSMINLWSVSNDFLKSVVVQESGCLLSGVITSVFTQCGVLTNKGGQKSPKKKKSDSVIVNFQQIIAVIGLSDIQWSREITSEHLEKLTEASKSLEALWNCKNTLQLEDTKLLLSCVKIIKQLPLEYLWSCDQIRCLFGLLAVKYLTNQLEDQSEQVSSQELSEECIEACTCIVETMETKCLFEVLSAPGLLDILQKMIASLTLRTPLYYRCLVLLEVTCRRIVQVEGSLEKLIPYTDKLVSKIGKTKECDVFIVAMYILQELTKMWSTPSITENVQTICRKIFEPLSKQLVKLSPLLDSSTRDHKEAVLVRIYAAILPVVNKCEELKKEVQGNFIKIVHWCENVLQNVEKTDVYTVLSALIFLHTFSKHHAPLKIPLNIEDKLRIWSLLVTVLRKLLHSQSDDSGNQTVSENQSVEMRTQSKSEGQNQSKRKIQDTQSAEESEAKTPKKKRKSMKGGKSGESCGSNQCLDKIQDDLSKQARKIAMILNGLSDSSMTRKEVNSCRCKMPVAGRQSAEVEEITHSPSMMYSLLTSFMFEGRLETQRLKVIKMHIQSMMAELLMTFDLEQFKTILQELVDGVHVNELFGDHGKIQSSLYIWRYLLKHKFSNEQTVIIRYSARDIMVNVQSISQQLQHTESDNLLTEVAIPVLHTQQQMLASGPKFLGSRSSVLCLYSCLYTPLGGSTYFPAFNAVYNVLDTFLIYHPEVVFQNIPTFLSCAKRLLLSLVEQSDQDKIAQQPDVIKALLGCAFEMEKLFSQMSKHKVEFSKVAVYVVSDYVTAIQKVTLLPAVKRALVPAVHKMLDLCDKHAIAQLHVILGQGVREVFKLLYNDYRKFHKYKGKI